MEVDAPLVGDVEDRLLRQQPGAVLGQLEDGAGCHPQRHHDPAEDPSDLGGVRV
jgi:hypothetical protein